MCGIAGLLGKFDADAGKRLSQSLSHRGPDEDDIFEDRPAGLTLCHRRLAIVDLTAAGHQPMADASGRFVLSYNGEIYNSAELRTALEQRGCGFRGHSDSEVLIELFARDGIACLERLNGIFAFAVWDRLGRTLTLVRDQYGVKPLYWTQTPSGLAFASEIKALLALPDLDRTVDSTAAAAYLTYLWSPGERTMFRSVRKLPPGSWLQAGADGRTSSGRFFRLPDPQPQPMSDADAIAGTRERLEAAVRRQLMADVEVGAFLSGGLDSTSIVHFANAHYGQPVRCFTARYDSGSDELMELHSDLPYARRMARHFGSELIEVEVDDGIADEFPALVGALDEPQADPAALLSMKIAGAAHGLGLKVLLSGTGGDDIFTGYRRHLAAAFDPLIGIVPAIARQRLARAGRRHGPLPESFRRRLAKFLGGVEGDAVHRAIVRFEWLSRDIAAALLVDAPDPQAVCAPLLGALAEFPSEDALERTLRLDQLFFLTDHNLNYADKTGMAHSVEIRVPFLDLELVQWAARLPRRAKLRGLTTKWVLRRAMEPLLPRDIIHRPKTGFGLPLRSWLRGRMRPMMEELLSRRAIEARGILDWTSVERLKRDTLDGRADGSYSLLGAMAIELWARRFIDSPLPEIQLVGPTRAKRGIATSKAVPSSSTMR